MDLVLAKDEEIKAEEIFTANLVLFWLKTKFTLTNKRVIGQSPNTLFGFIPFGKREVVQPLKSVTSVSSSTEFHIGRFITGILLLLIGAMISTWASVLILVIPGLIMVLNCYTASFQIVSNITVPQGYELSILEKSKVERFVSKINTVISEL